MDAVAAHKHTKRGCTRLLCNWVVPKIVHDLRIMGYGDVDLVQLPMEDGFNTHPNAVCHVLLERFSVEADSPNVISRRREYFRGIPESPVTL